jgi:predicted GIY-YIG superfamily endonuclease
LADKCNWPGTSGKTYTYHVYPIGHSLKAEAGNYIFAKLNAQGQWSPLYIGETEDLDDRVATHEKRECVKRNGGTHIHAHLTPGDRSIRLNEETDIRNNFTTTCNDQ